MAVQVRLEETPLNPTLNVALCGSFRRDWQGLVSTFETLRDLGLNVVSPIELDFVSESHGFVYTRTSDGATPGDIEARHLGLMLSADFVWLHTLDGYVGSSACLEIGFATAAGIPIFTSTLPSDVTLAAMVTLVPSPHAATEVVQRERVGRRGAPIRALQEHYRLVSARRGYDGERPNQIMLLLVEEIGELARAIRKELGLHRDRRYTADSMADELADVQLYLVHLANAIGVDLADAVSTKEMEVARGRVPAEHDLP